MEKKCSTSGKNQYSMIEVLAKISSIMYCIIKYILKKMLLGNIETFEMDKYYKLFPDQVEKIH